EYILNSSNQHKTSLLDYRFGWRWLLPLQANQHICLQGFDEDESSFWKDALLPATITNFPDSADIWIVNADSLDSAATPCCSGLDNVSTVCAFGRGSIINHWRSVLKKSSFIDIREYGLLPHSNPRVVVPLDSHYHAAQGLSLHRPGRLIAQLGILFARVLAGIGVYAPLRRNVLLIANKTPDTVPIGANQARVLEHFSQQILDYALYLGTPDDNRKTVVLPLGEDLPDTILKSGSSLLARKALLNEHQSLSAMRETPLCSSVPLIKGIVDCQHCISLYLEFRPRISRKIKEMKPYILEFLSGLSRIERHERSLNYYLEAMDMDYVSAHLKKWLVSRAQQGIGVCEHRGHGDFAQWNVSWSSKGLFVYDWEESRPCMPAFWDCFYYVAAPALRIQKQPDPASVAGQCIDFARLVALASGLEHLDVTCHFVLWCLNRINVEPFYGQMLATLDLETT
ncbi:MAG: hypothetical protein WA003_08500, partial [Desulfuromonadaceae bacterium]